MHNKAKEMACWAMDKAKACGYDNLTSQDWDDLKDCMEAAKCAICIDKDYRIIEAMDEAEKAERMGYKYPRNDGGRNVQVGGEHYRRYSHVPYLEENDYLMDYANNPKDFLARMGYPVDHMLNQHNSKYGEAYDGWENAKRHFTETHDAKSKEEMDKYTKEHMHRTLDAIYEMYKEADQPLKEQIRSEFGKTMERM